VPLYSIYIKKKDLKKKNGYRLKKKRIMGNLFESAAPIKKSETSQSIENYLESLEIDLSKEDKEKYEKIILHVIQQVKSLKVELFNHEFTLQIRPVQGK